MQVPSTITVANGHNNNLINGFIQDETFQMDIPDKLTGIIYLFFFKLFLE